MEKERDVVNIVDFVLELRDLGFGLCFAGVMNKGGAILFIFIGKRKFCIDVR